MQHRVAPASISGKSLLQASILALAVCAIAFIPMRAAQAQTFHLLYTFTGGADGQDPNGLTMDRAGRLYGTTTGPGYCYTGQCGGVFEFSRSGAGWIFSSLYHFRGGSDGTEPFAAVTVAPDGSLYGTTVAGSGASCNYGSVPGCGTVYHLRPPATRCASFFCPWNNTIVYAFQGWPDLASPYAGVTLDRSGNLYGATVNGGASAKGGVFELKPVQGGWSYSVLHDFTGYPDGSEPFGAVLVDQAGNVYGTTGLGGSGLGTAFELQSGGSGWNENFMYSLGGTAYPVVGLTSDSQGNLYGATSGGGHNNNGSIFELTPANGSYNYTLLYQDFEDPYGDYRGPQSRLVIDQAGNLYGTQYGGGAYAQGMVFKLSPGSGSWTLTDLHDFNGSDGSNPSGDLVLDSNGNLYGTTQGGTIWEITFN